MWLLLAVVIDVSRFRSPLVTYDVNCARTWPLSNRINVFYGIAFASVQLLLYFFVFVYCRASFMSVRWLDGINFSLFKMLFQYYLSHIHARIPQNEWAHNNLMIVKFIWLIVSFSCWFFSLLGQLSVLIFSDHLFVQKKRLPGKSDIIISAIRIIGMIILHNILFISQKPPFTDTHSIWLFFFFMICRQTTHSAISIKWKGRNKL